MTQRLCLLALLGLLTCLPAKATEMKALPPESLKALLEGVLPDYTVEITGQITAKAVAQGQTLYLLVPAVSFEHKGKAYVAAVVGFSNTDRMQPAVAVEGRPPAKDVRPALLVLAPAAAPKESKSKVIDVRAQGMQMAGLSLEDTGDPEGPLLRLDASLIYAKSGTIANIAQRVFLYRLPELEEVLGATVQIIEYRNGIIDKRVRGLRMVKGAAGEPSRVELMEPQGKKIQVPLGKGHPVYNEEAAWDPAPQPLPAGKSAPDALRIRVVDPKGAPIAGAKLKVATKHVSIWDVVNWQDAPPDESTAVTDAQGEVTLPLGSGLTVDIEAPGYYPAHAFWLPRDRPAATVTVPLRPEDQRVQMLACDTLQRSWRERTDRVELGIDFDVPADDPNKGMTDDKQEAEVWIEMFKPQRAQKSDSAAPKLRRSELTTLWQMRMTGLNGWTLAPGPRTLSYPEPEDPSMRVAPEEGYVERIEFRGDQFPEGVYLRGPGNERFGKFAPIRMKDGSDTRSNYFLVTLWGGYAVQTEDTGSRSLNPAERNPAP